MSRVLIIGGGASGMAAALSAGESGENKVVVLERQARAGRKLMTTGNGRCNLTNLKASREYYHGADADFVIPALREFPPEKVLDWFRGIGLLTVAEDSGRVYPLSNSANSVVDVLRFAMEAAGVELRGGVEVRAIKRRGSGFAALFDGGELYADDLIIACGGAAGEKLGGVGAGYELLKSMGHSRTELRPSLTQLVTEPDYPRALKGIKADAALSLRRGRECLAETGGEILFTEKGVSGPAAFDISRAVSCAGGDLSLDIDLMRGYSQAEALDILRSRREAAPGLPAGELLTGALHNRLGRMLVKYAALDAGKTLSELSDGDLGSLASACKRFSLPLRGVEGFIGAQVTAGGVRTSEFHADSMESRIVPHLYACGEVLDIDGDCGGYNLQWAWASGLLAGRLG